MAVRLQMKLGFVADSDRVADSPDTIRTHEPVVGAVVRSKGYLCSALKRRSSRRVLTSDDLMATITAQPA